jgi:4-hydroxy-tetrahydrodipicolinate synthase
MSHAERTLTLKTALRLAKGKVPVIAGTGSNNTHTAIMYTEEAKELGADAVLIVTPYYNKCTQAGLIAHYTAIAEAVDIPIIMYNVPSRTGLNMLSSTVLELAKVPNIAGIKEASGNIGQVMEIAAGMPADFALISGEDALIYPLLACGGDGVISVASNIVPGFVAEICTEYFAGNIAKSRQMQYKMLPLVSALFAEVNPIPVKYAASLMGLCENEMRLPLTPMANKALMEKAMKDFGITF